MEFWKREYKCPITEEDRLWVEEAMLALMEMFGADYLKDKQTVLPTKDFFDYDFKGEAEDAQFVLKRLYELMDIDGWEISLHIKTLSVSSFDVKGSPSGGISTSWKGAAGTYLDKGLGTKEISIEPETVKDPVALISTLAHELCHYKLLGENRIEGNDEYLTDLTVIAFGLGICIANSSFSFSQWGNASRQGWNMSKKGYLPEPVIAYAMAWLAHYKNEDVGWDKYLNKTVKRYFQDSYGFIKEGREFGASPAVNEEDNKGFVDEVLQEDFVRVEQLLIDDEAQYIDNADSDYYLFAFSDDELLDVVAKYDEWNAFDVVLARELLNERGVKINEEELKAKRLKMLQKPEQIRSIWIVVSYLSAFLGGFLGILIGWYLLTSKKTLPNDEEIYAYSDIDRRHGRRMFFIGVMVLVAVVGFRIIV